MCNNYRGVALLCKKYKIPANILCLKLAPYAEEVIEHHRGFQRGRTTVDQILL
jgi:hypothetical protein